jgi:hypothetical protein
MGGQCVNKHMYHTECIGKMKRCILCYKPIEKIQGSGVSIFDKNTQSLEPINKNTKKFEGKMKMK